MLAKVDAPDFVELSLLDGEAEVADPAGVAVGSEEELLLPAAAVVLPSVRMMA